ncbi:hypothetical protein [Thermodesulfobacterium hydrogeniphilum]|uniref:hypothetical protein n=1 Tax=Thermodesulfobacterium hydrogeniphilum TaxID=161156 RepID=UPI00057013DA|nr:hypothetical protein [Thermodesulfobacterium hydrogeniphilum]
MKIYKSFNKKSGFTILIVLTIGVLLLILGITVAYITHIGYFSISAEAKYQIAEKKSNFGLMKAIDYIMNNNVNCADLSSQSYEYGIEIQSKLVNNSWGSACFIWSKGNFMNAKVIKIGVITIPISTYGAAIIKNLSYFNIRGSSAIVSCNENCTTPALVIGNEYSGLTGSTVDSCPHNPKGIIALVKPIKQNAIFNLYNLAFNEIDTRTELLNNLQTLFGVEFNNGTPVGVNGTKVWTPPSDIKIYNCTANTNITCTTNGTSIDFIYNSDSNTFTSSLDSKSYDALDLGNATLNINSFNGSAKIAAGTINISNFLSQATLVAKNQINITSNNVNITNANLFAQSYEMTGNNLNIAGGIIYAGGSGTAIFNLNSNTNIGSLNNPTLIILDNTNVNIGKNGNVDIYGLIFITEANNNVNIKGSGNFELHGVLASNSQNTNIDLSGNFEILFDKQVIEKLSNISGLIRYPICENLSIKIPLIFTKMRIY